MFFFIIRVYLLLLFFEGNKGDRLNGGGTGRPQVRERVSRIASPRLGVYLVQVLLPRLVALRYRIWVLVLRTKSHQTPIKSYGPG